MELQLSWPSGYFSLFTASKDSTDVCPQGTGFKWRSGSVTDQNHVLIASTNLEFIGVGAYVGVKYGFCTKTKEPGSSYFSQVWPSGKYCILRKSSNPGNPSCPKSKLHVSSFFPRVELAFRRIPGFLAVLKLNK